MTRPQSWLRAVVAIVITAVFVLPLYIALVSVFKPSSLIVSEPLLPTGLTLDNLIRVLSEQSGGTWGLLANSAMITSASLVTVVLAAAMLAFFINRSPRFVGRIILPILLIGLMLPAQVFLVPLVQILRGIGLMGTLPGLFLFNIGYYLPFGVLLFVGALRTIPRQIDEAAQVDGAGTFRVFFSIYLPLLRPAVTSVVIIVGVWIWNDFLNPLIILGPAFGTTVTVGIYRAIGQFQSDYGIVFALSLVAMTPVIVLFLALQKYFVKGLTSGGIKG
jgi:raffinose/stachyose/melibiose transport system permease protein